MEHAFAALALERRNEMLGIVEEVKQQQHVLMARMDSLQDSLQAELVAMEERLTARMDRVHDELRAGQQAMAFALRTFLRLALTNAAAATCVFPCSSFNLPQPALAAPGDLATVNGGALLCWQDVPRPRPHPPAPLLACSDFGLASADLDAFLQQPQQAAEGAGEQAAEAAERQQE